MSRENKTARLGSAPPRIVSAPPGPTSRALARRLIAAESPAFEARRGRRANDSGADQSPIVYARGHGANVVDVDGNRYVDLTAGFGALLLGHTPSVVTRAVQAQERDLSLALGDVYPSKPKVDLMVALAAIAVVAVFGFGLTPASVFSLLGREPNLTGRTDFWPYLQQAIADRPWLGYGYNAFFRSGVALDYLQDYIVGAGGWTPYHAHNSFLQILLDSGYVGLASLGLLLVDGLR